MHFTVKIQSPRNIVFCALTDTDELLNVLPSIIRIEHLSDTRRGLGTRYREVHEINGREFVVEYEVLEFIENEFLRVAVFFKGKVIDTEATFTQEGEQTLVTVKTEGRNLTIMGKLLGIVFGRANRRAHVKNWMLIKAYCEAKMHADMPARNAR